MLYLAAAVGLIFGCVYVEDAASPWPLVLLIVSGVWLLVGWIPFCGLKVLKPQEALVLTLFGKYVGTLKSEGFYYVNPFCTAVNPAAKTRLNQSGDVDGGAGKSIVLAAGQSSANVQTVNNKISLKIMTLNNNRQKINDCLGNPVEIGIAVMWRVVDTAKAVFNVDNYKEYLSLQCDSALRNIVRIYPYDVAPNVDTTGDGVADEGSLRGSSEIVASRIRDEIQRKVGEAGLEILEARITYLAYAAGDRGSHASAAAGVRHHRCAQDDRRWRGGHGGDGIGPPEREPDHHPGRGTQGGYGVQPAGGPLRQPRRPACRQLRKPVLIWRRTRKNKSRCDCRPSCTTRSLPGRRTTSVQ